MSVDKLISSAKAELELLKSNKTLKQETRKDLKTAYTNLQDKSKATKIWEFIQFRNRDKTLTPEERVALKKAVDGIVPPKVQLVIFETTTEKELGTKVQTGRALVALPEPAACGTLADVLFQLGIETFSDLRRLKTHDPVLQQVPIGARNVILDLKERLSQQPNGRASDRAVVEIAAVGAAMATANVVKGLAELFKRDQQIVLTLENHTPYELVRQTAPEEIHGFIQDATSIVPPEKGLVCLIASKSWALVGPDVALCFSFRKPNTTEYLNEHLVLDLQIGFGTLSPCHSVHPVGRLYHVTDTPLPLSSHSSYSADNWFDAAFITVPNGSTLENSFKSWVYPENGEERWKFRNSKSYGHKGGTAPVDKVSGASHDGKKFKLDKIAIGTHGDSTTTWRLIHV